MIIETPFKAPDALKRIALLLFCLGFFADTLYAQAELQPWGNLNGIRKDGQLFNFESSLVVVQRGWANSISTKQEAQQPKYIRDDRRQIVNTAIDSLLLSEQVTEAGKGKAQVKIEATGKADMPLEGIFFRIKLPTAYNNGTIKTDGSTPAYSIAQLQSTSLKISAKTISLVSDQQQIKIQLTEATDLLIKKSGTGAEVYLPVLTGNVAKGQSAVKEFSIEVSGAINQNPVNVKLDAGNQGRLFEGFGGNFRLQNPKTDPQVIDYCLDNMRVAWGRVEMPFAFWQPEKNTDPLQQDPNGNLNPHVRESMQMAQRLQKIGMPIILTSWNAPKWAIIGEPRYRPKPGEQWGNQLNYDNIQATYKSIADYIVYLKDKFGVDVQLFSFNESDLGINIRVTGKEHDELIKGLGAYFISRGLKTKMLLGDNSDATTYEFIYPALNDPDARQYIGAISFHSWRGWETETLQKWADAARQINAPLIVGEGSIDAAAWNYPAIFQEQIYAIEEINLYLRLLAICQPITILQWQLTADYSPLIGGGIFGNNEPLHPGQRFWNLKQLASTPKNVYAINTTADQDNVTCAAMANNQTQDLAVHLVNNGAKREFIISGIPSTRKKLSLYITSKDLSMKKKTKIEVKNGEAHLTLPAVCFASLITE
jgi:O-glycosyl hydrolase